MSSGQGSSLGRKMKKGVTKVPRKPTKVCVKRKEWMRGVFDPNSPFISVNPHHHLRLHQLTAGTTRKQVVSSIAPHKPTMESLGIYGVVKDAFEDSGLVEWMLLMKRETYNKLVVEFYSTFEPLRDENGNCVGWSYSINNENVITSKDLVNLDWFNFNEGQRVIPVCSDEQRMSVWRKLTGMAEYNPNCSPKCIRSGAWKYIHRLVATNINTRVDQGSRVSREDLDLLYYMEKRQPIDWFHVLTERFKKMTSIKEKSKALGCASIVTSLAKFEGFRFESLHDDFRELNTARLVTMHLYDAGGREWIYKPEMPKGAAGKGKKKMEGSNFDWEEC